MHEPYLDMTEWGSKCTFHTVCFAVVSWGRPSPVGQPLIVWDNLCLPCSLDTSCLKKVTQYQCLHISLMFKIPFERCSQNLQNIYVTEMESVWHILVKLETCAFGFSSLNWQLPFVSPWGLITVNKQQPVNDHWSMHHSWKELCAVFWLTGKVSLCFEKVD